MTTITSVAGRRVWDSRGRPTVEVEVHAGGHAGRAIAPAGASTGSAEAVERRDGGEAFGGRDVRHAVANVAGVIAPAIVGLDVADQSAIDAAIVACDPSPTLATVGANAAVATSLACLHAAAAVAGVPLWRSLRGADDGPVIVPLPEIQIFGGGAHAGRRIDIQDLMVMAPGATSFAEALDWTAEIYRAAGAGRAGTAGVADEGGWWPGFDSNEEAIETLATAVGAAGFALGRDVVLSLDIAASELWRDGRYRLALEDRDISTDEMVELVARWCHDYSIASVEDPLGEHDSAGMRAFTAAMGDRVQVIGDDLYVTNAARVSELADAATAVLVKVNQAGTVTRTRAALDAARAHGLGAVVSARSGESEDVSIVHLAVGWGAAQFKVGSITRGERTAKWNEMLHVEESLGDRARFAGWAPLPAPAVNAPVGGGRVVSGPVRNVLGVVGSLRAGSYNHLLMRHAAATAPERLRIDVAADIIDLPLFNEDLKVDGLPEPVVALQDRIRAADGILIATPEYNFGVPGTVKNLVDWASRPPRRSPLTGKPIALMGASVGKTGGTVQCQGQLRVSFAVLGAHVLPWPPVLVAEAPDKFDADGNVTDEMTRTVVGIALAGFLDLIDTLSPTP